MSASPRAASRRTSRAGSIASQANPPYSPAPSSGGRAPMHIPLWADSSQTPVSYPSTPASLARAFSSASTPSNASHSAGGSATSQPPRTGRLTAGTMSSEAFEAYLRSQDEFFGVPNARRSSAPSSALISARSISQPGSERHVSQTPSSPAVSDGSDIRVGRRPVRPSGIPSDASSDKSPRQPRATLRPANIAGSRPQITRQASPADSTSPKASSDSDVPLRVRRQRPMSANQVSVVGPPRRRKRPRSSTSSASSSPAASQVAVPGTSHDVGKAQRAREPAEVKALDSYAGMKIAGVKGKWADSRQEMKKLAAAPIRVLRSRAKDYLAEAEQNR